MSCVFCGTPGRHQCAGGVAIEKPGASALSCDWSRVTFFPAWLDGNYVTAKRYELVHAHGPELLERWREQQIHSTRREMP